MVQNTRRQFLRTAGLTSTIGLAAGAGTATASDGCSFDREEAQDEWFYDEWADGHSWTTTYTDRHGRTWTGTAGQAVFAERICRDVISRPDGNYYRHELNVGTMAWGLAEGPDGWDDESALGRMGLNLEGTFGYAEVDRPTASYQITAGRMLSEDEMRSKSSLSESDWDWDSAGEILADIDEYHADEFPEGGSLAVGALATMGGAVSTPAGVLLGTLSLGLGIMEMAESSTSEADYQWTLDPMDDPHMGVGSALLQGVTVLVPQSKGANIGRVEIEGTADPTTTRIADWDGYGMGERSISIEPSLM